MTFYHLLEFALYWPVLLALLRPLGASMARVCEGKPCLLGGILGPPLRFLYRLRRTDPASEKDRRMHELAMLLFNVVLKDSAHAQTRHDLHVLQLRFGSEAAFGLDRRGPGCVGMNRIIKAQAHVVTSRQLVAPANRRSLTS